MIGNVDMDQLADKFGGRYKLTVLIQKRLKELVRGAARLVELEDRNLINIVLEEIKQGKIGYEEYALQDGDKDEKKKK